jgi:hypothetical protein
MKLLILAVIVIFAIAAWIAISRQKRSRPDTSASDKAASAGAASRTAASDGDVDTAQRTFLLVILRRAPIELKPQSLETAARSAWGGRFGANKGGSNYVERGKPDFMYVLQAHGNAFTVIATRKRGRELAPPTKFFPESATALWDEHTDDVSVGIAYAYDTDPARLAAFVSTLTASLCDDQSIAVYHPESRRLWKLDEATRKSLAEGSRAFFGGETD